MVQVELRLQRREHFEADGVRSHRSKMTIPQKAQHAFALLQPRMLGLLLQTVADLLLLVHLVPGLGQADAEEEDIALLKADVAFAGDREDVVQRDHVLAQGVDADPSFLRPCQVVD